MSGQTRFLYRLNPSSPFLNLPTFSANPGSYFIATATPSRLWITVE